MVANRRIMPVPKGGFACARPEAALTAVHANLLEDLVAPRRSWKRQLQADRQPLLKVYLDARPQHPEYKLTLSRARHKKMTGKDVSFEFPVTEATTGRGTARVIRISAHRGGD